MYFVFFFHSLPPSSSLLLSLSQYVFSPLLFLSLTFLLFFDNHEKLGEQLICLPFSATVGALAHAALSWVSGGEA